MTGAGVPYPAVPPRRPAGARDRRWAVLARGGCATGSAGSPSGACGCSCSVTWLAVISEGDLDGPFVGASDDVELDGAAPCGLECVGQVVGGVYRVTRG